MFAKVRDLYTQGEKIISTNRGIGLTWAFYIIFLWFGYGLLKEFGTVDGIFTLQSSSKTIPRELTKNLAENVGFYKSYNVTSPVCLSLSMTSVFLNYTEPSG